METMLNQTPEVETATYHEQRYDLIRKMRKKEIHLSHSSFNEFCKSPRHFIRYKLKEKKTTDAMRFGSMVHCAILEPEKFDDLYFVAPKCDRRTKKGKLLWEMALIEAGEREVVSADDYEAAKKAGETVRRNNTAGALLEKINRFESPVEWKYKGWNWRGFIDMDGVENNVIADLKVLADVSPHKVANYVKYEGAGRQAVHYLRAKDSFESDYYILAVDRIGNCSVSKIGKGLINQFRREIDWYLNKLQTCIFLNDWNASYDFYLPDGVNEINAI